MSGYFCFGGYECKFVDSPKELQFLCRICLSILRNPCHLDCDCGYSFCGECIMPIYNDKDLPCPLCNVDFSCVIPDKKLKRDLGQREVFCSNRKLGCIWRGSLAEFDQHLNLQQHKNPEDRFNGCPVVELRCIHKDCVMSVKRSKLRRHELKKCEHRPYKCRFCQQYEGTYAVVVYHWPVCPFQPVPCPNECGASPKRKDLASHVDNDCPLTVVDCDFHYAGCAVRLPRKYMPEHIKRNSCKHVELLVDFLHEEVAKLSRIVGSCTERVNANSNTADEQFAIFECAVDMQSKENDSLRVQIHRVQLELDMLKEAQQKPKAITPKPVQESDQSCVFPSKNILLLGLAVVMYWILTGCGSVVQELFICLFTMMVYCLCS